MGAQFPSTNHSDAETILIALAQPLPMTIVEEAHAPVHEVIHHAALAAPTHHERRSTSWLRSSRVPTGAHSVQ